MLTLHYHPLSSCCWKLLIALAENGSPFEARIVNLGDPAERAAHAALWPTAKIPLLVDDDRVVPETSLQIEHLDHHHPGRQRLLPEGFDAQLNARLWDRLFDLYVMTPMQRYIGEQLRPEAERDARDQAAYADALTQAYDLIESRLGAGPWAVGEQFSMADCAAAPALFYATLVQPFSARHERLNAYFERLLARPSVWQTLVQARPWFQYYPLRQRLPQRFLTD